MDGEILKLKELLAQFWQRKWIALACAWAVAIVGLAGTVVLPDQYRASSRIYVDTDSLIAPLMKGLAIEDDVGHQVAVMERTLLSGPNLLEVVRAVDLDLEARNDAEMEALIEKMRKQTSVRADGLKIFSVQYTDKEPERARNVVQALINIFVESNVGKDREDMESVRIFIDKQLEEYEQKLKQTEIQIAEFKAKNADVLNQGQFSSRVERARSDVSNARLEYEDQIVRRAQLADQLAQTPKFLEVDSPTSVVVTNSNFSPYELRMHELQSRLDELLLRYTEQHPDVIAVRRQLEAVKAQGETGSGRGGTSYQRQKATIPNSLYEQIRLKLLDMDSDLASSRRRLEKTEEEYDRLQLLSAKAPNLEAELADLNREYSVWKSKYEDLLVRSEAARLSGAIAADTEAVRFRIVDPPKTPAIPSGPNRLLLLAGSLVAALGLGSGLALLLAQLDDTYNSIEKLRQNFGLNVIGVVSSFRDSGSRMGSAIGNAAFLTGLVLLVGVFAATYVALPELGHLREALLDADLNMLKQQLGRYV